MLATCSVLLCSCVATTEVCLLLRRKCVCCYDGSVFVATTEMCLLLRQKCVCCYDRNVFVATTEVCLLLLRKCVCCYDRSVFVASTEVCLSNECNINTLLGNIYCFLRSLCKY